MAFGFISQAQEQTPIDQASLQIVQVLTDRPLVAGARCGHKRDCRWVYFQYTKFESGFRCLDSGGNFCRWETSVRRVRRSF
jgi:hypothetical protein